MMKKVLLLTISLLIWSLHLIGQEEKLEVEGAIQIGNSEDSSPDPGTIRWTGSDFEGWNGTCWLSLTGEVSCPTPTDGDGNTYESVIIGTQEWLTTDLRTTKCNDGTAIPLVTGNPAWSALSTGGYSWYNNDEVTQVANGYGALYNWYAVNECNICPTGWHVPSDAEWTTLIDYLDPGDVDSAAVVAQSTIAGGKMKEAGLAHWDSPNTAATNESGWSGLPGGLRNSGGAFDSLGSHGYFWSSTESGGDAAWRRNLFRSTSYAYRTSNGKRFGFSVRCLRD